MKVDHRNYDVVVIGGGHAGCEAALAASRIGAKTAMITMSMEGVACMPCNPSIGGVAKSHLVYELDALGGEMPVNADFTGIQFRTLNTSRGPAVRSTRVQCDKSRYEIRMLAVLRAAANLDLIEDSVGDIVADTGKSSIAIRTLRGTVISSKTAVLTPGTSLNGVIHVGDASWPGGRHGSPASTDLSLCLRRLGLRMGRLKTGTPPRVDKNTVDYSRMEIQHGIDPPPFFSVKAVEARAMFHVEHKTSDLCPWRPGSDQLPCFVTQTTPETHRIVMENILSSSLYGGHIKGVGVRYCPSLEDKVCKFPDRDRHHVFIEYEGRSSGLIYPNGISNSMPRDVQERIVHSVPGLENAKIVEWAYAIEYDYCDPTQLGHSLEVKSVPNLFLAGQVNGTTGYEEAAAQGFVAGVNAALKSAGRMPLVLSRHEAYIGVMIDDLVLKGTDEPYRVFTSRAEHRLMLRQDDAKYRLIDKSKYIGIVDSQRLRTAVNQNNIIKMEVGRLDGLYLDGVQASKVLCRTGATYSQLPCADSSLPICVQSEVETIIKYRGYIEREARQVRRASALDNQAIPRGTDFSAIRHISRESQEKLSRIQPCSLGEAAQIPGVTPADLAILSMYLLQSAVQTKPASDASKIE